MSGSFVISLDFELMWGVRDHRTTRDYGDAVLGGRKAIPQMLSRFREANIRATWATVGLLFARSRSEMLEYSPEIRPSYAKTSLSPYPDLENGLVGENEQEDPLHFGASLINMIAETPGQEMATHTYSHYYCMEEGAEEASFIADMESAIRIATAYDHTLESIVFPRNQTTDQYVNLGQKLGITTFRGDANGSLYRPRSGQDTTILFRMARLMDSGLPIAPKQVVEPIFDGSSWNVPASRFLRPWSSTWSFLHDLHIRRIEAEMELAAQQGKCYHLWWHPHNFGRNTAQNLAQLDRILTCFKRCRDDYGMVSRNMRDFSG